MQKLSARRRWRRKDSETGAVIVEFAIVSVLFVTLLYALVAYGVLFMIKHDMANAAAQGARAGIGWDDPGLAQDRAKDVADAAILGLPATFTSNFHDVCTPGGGCTTAAVAACANEPGDCITVTVTYPYATHPVIPALPFFNHAMPDTLTATSVVALS